MKATRKLPHGNPFFAGSYGGHETFHFDASSRLAAVSKFTAEECRRGLKVDGLQKTVRTAIERRLRKLEAPR